MWGRCIQPPYSQMCVLYVPRSYRFYRCILPPPHVSTFTYLSKCPFLNASRIFRNSPNTYRSVLSFALRASLFYPWLQTAVSLATVHTYTSVCVTGTMRATSIRSREPLLLRERHQPELSWTGSVGVLMTEVCSELTGHTSVGQQYSLSSAVSPLHQLDTFGICWLILI